MSLMRLSKVTATGDGNYDMKYVVHYESLKIAVVALLTRPKVRLDDALVLMGA